MDMDFPRNGSTGARVKAGPFSSRSCGPMGPSKRGAGAALRQSLDATRRAGLIACAVGPVGLQFLAYGN